MQLGAAVSGVILLLQIGCATATPIQTQTPIDIRRGGDDGLTLQFAKALEDAFRNSPHFIVGSRTRARLVVTITTNLHWKRLGERTQVSYEVQFTSETGVVVGLSVGSCWEDQLTECAQQTVNDARKASERLRH